MWVGGEWIPCNYVSMIVFILPNYAARWQLTGPGTRALPPLQARHHSNIVFCLASKLELWIRIRIKFFRIRNLDPDPGDKIEEKMLKNNNCNFIFLSNLKWEQKPNFRF